MNTCLTVQKSGGLRTAMLAALSITSAHAKITVDGIRDGLDTGYTERAVFLGSRPDDNAFILFIDSNPGGVNFIPNNLITVGDEAYTINNLGSSNTAGLTFETV